MHQGKFVLAQLTSYLVRYEFNKCVERYNGNYKVRTFSCWSQFICMMFGQLTHRESITDIILCLNAHSGSVYHLGIQQVVAVSTLTRANEQRNWHIYADFASYLLGITRPLYANDNDFALELDNTVYAFDSTTIDLCLSVFFWARFRKTKAAVKLHTLLDLRGNLPTFIHITDGKVHDVNALDELFFEENAFYIMDRAYVDFCRLFKITQSLSFFVVRAKNNLKFRCVASRTVDKLTGLRCDQTIRLLVKKSADDYPAYLRRVKFYDKEKQRMFVFLTNNFKVEPLQIAMLYKQRWQVELFFKWIKQHLRITSFWGHSKNAVKTQIWIAVCTYLLVAYIKKQLKVEQSLYEMLQIISVSAFTKVPLNELLTNLSKNNEIKSHCNQLKMFDL
ncbi:MAG: IS4 family transposase [Bacteroidetes bacterium]|nr:IS4 family transposase [Bacteroidota bacterium]